MKLTGTFALLVTVVLLGPSPPAHAEGGELGNAFIRFDSRIGRYSLEYAKGWRVNDLSQSTTFDEATSASAAESFFTVEADVWEARNSADLGARLKELRPDVAWSSTSLSGISGYTGVDRSVRMYYLMRAAGDLLILRMRSADGSRSDGVLAHMLSTFHAFPAQ